MNLRQYLDRHNIKIVEAARIIGVVPQTLSAIINAGHIPSRSTAAGIEKFTKGEVSAESLLLKRWKPCKCPHCGKQIKGEEDVA